MASIIICLFFFAIFPLMFFLVVVDIRHHPGLNDYTFDQFYLAAGNMFLAVLLILGKLIKYLLLRSIINFLFSKRF